LEKFKTSKNTCKSNVSKPQKKKNTFKPVKTQKAEEKPAKILDKNFPYKYCKEDSEKIITELQNGSKKCSQVVCESGTFGMVDKSGFDAKYNICLNKIRETTVAKENAFCVKECKKDINCTKICEECNMKRIRQTLKTNLKPDYKCPYTKCKNDRDNITTYMKKEIDNCVIDTCAEDLKENDFNEKMGKCTTNLKNKKSENIKRLCGTKCKLTKGGKNCQKLCESCNIDQVSKHVNETIINWTASTCLAYVKIELIIPSITKCSTKTSDFVLTNNYNNPKEPLTTNLYNNHWLKCINTFCGGNSVNSCDYTKYGQ